MTDIIYNLTTNDIEFLNGDFRTTDACGQQNAALIINKSCVNIMSPDIGIGLEEIYPNIRNGRLRILLDQAARQIYDDGGASVDMSYAPTNAGEYEITTRVKYRGE